jgi:putative transcriptional regulator
MPTRTRKPFFERVKQGLTESLQHERGQISLKSTEFPDPPPEIDAATLTAVRQKARMSQAVFARLLNVSPKTIQSWEQGLRSPSMASRRLIHVFAERPDVVCEVAGLRPVTLDGLRIVPSAKGKRRIVLSP